MSTSKTIKSTILRITVANQKTVHPGDVVELSETDFKILEKSEKAKKYEAGDEKKYKVEEPKKNKQPNA